MGSRESVETRLIASVASRGVGGDNGVIFLPCPPCPLALKCQGDRLPEATKREPLYGLTLFY
ncbi:hypothetical protein, partial [Nostoc sp.]